MVKLLSLSASLLLLLSVVACTGCNQNPQAATSATSAASPTDNPGVQAAKANAQAQAAAKQGH